MKQLDSHRTWHWKSELLKCHISPIPPSYGEADSAKRHERINLGPTLFTLLSRNSASISGSDRVR